MSQLSIKPANKFPHRTSDRFPREYGEKERQRKQQKGIKQPGERETERAVEKKVFSDSF